MLNRKLAALSCYCDTIIVHDRSTMINTIRETLSADIVRGQCLRTAFGFLDGAKSFSTGVARLKGALGFVMQECFFFVFPKEASSNNF